MLVPALKNPGNTPNYNYNCITEPGTYFIYYPAKGQETNCIGGSECHNNMRKISFRPVKFFFQDRFQQAYYLAIEIIYGSRKKQQDHNQPPVVFYFCSQHLIICRLQEIAIMF